MTPPAPISDGTNVPEIRTMHGLYLQPNTFGVPDGALEEANNVVIRDDNTIGSRRGYYKYFSPTAGTYNYLALYNAVLMGIYTNKIAYYTATGSSPNQTGTETVLGGTSFTISGVSKTLNASSNLYFTTDDGVMKITNYNSPVSNAGAPPGLDLILNFAINNSSAWFLAGNIVGYRGVFGYNDANDNLVLGPPSQFAEIVNPLITGSSYTSTGSGPWVITVTHANHGLFSGYIMLFSAGTSGNANGAYTIIVTGANTFTYSENIGDPTTGTVSYCFNMSTLIEATIPSQITSALPWFFRLYRSTQQPSTGAIFDDFALISQIPLTPAMITAGVVFVDDNIPDILRGIPLYTNTNNGEGELQTNNAPPLCQDLCSFQNYTIYANCTTRQLLYLSFVNPSVMSAGDTISFKIDSTTWTYVAATGVANQTVVGEVSSSTGLLVTYNAHGFANGWEIYVSNITGGTLTAGFYFVVSSSTNSFKISLTVGGSAIAYNGETSLYFEGLNNGTHNIFFLSTSTSAAVRLSQTAIYFVKAVNRDDTSDIYAQYLSVTSNSVPGQMSFSSINFTDPVFAAANTTTVGTALFPALPNTFDPMVATQVSSSNNIKLNRIYISKLGENEAVPLVNFQEAGSTNAPIYRIIALRDVVIIVKADGVFRLTGDSISNFTITILDNTIFCVASSSVTVLNNQVVFLSNQGVCLISESSVQIISRAKIEDEIQPILGQATLAAQTSGMGYETERLYLLTTNQPNTTTASIVWAYNILTNEWTSWDTLFAQAAIGPSDTMYYIGLDNNLYIERKTQTAYDYSDQNHGVTITSINADGITGTITITAPDNYFPKEGDMIVSNSVITWLDRDPLLISGSTYSCVFTPNNNLSAGDVLILYASFYHQITFSPFHAGLLSKMKLFSQFMVHLRNSAMTKAIITFSGYALGGSGQIIWQSTLVAQGWGNPPWGFFGWGQENTINLQIGTQPAGVVRTYIPPYQARTTFIQAGIEHRKAGEPLEIQAISYVVRPYNERVTR